jgi:hypothetical protein
MPVLIENQMIPTVKVSQDSFDHKQIARCTLCIEIDESRFRFCFVDEENSQCVWLEDYAFDTFLNASEYLAKLKKLVGEHPFLSSDQWKDIRVSVNTHEFTLIPGPLFRKEYAGDYLQMATGWPVQPDTRVLHQLLPAINAYTVFSLPSTWSDWLLNQYPLQNIGFYHLTGPLITGALESHDEYGMQKLLTIQLEQNYFTMVFTDQKKLIFCNRFPYQTPAELTYLILFSMNQLQVSPEETQVRLYGEVTLYSELYAELSKFLPDLDFGKNPSSLQYISSFEDIPEHRYFGLLNTFQLS